MRRRVAILVAVALLLGVGVLVLWRWRPGRVGSAADSPSPIDAGAAVATVADAGPVLLGGERLAGRVVDLEAEGVPGVDVIVEPDTAAAAAGGAVATETDGDGAFAVGGLAPGVYRIHVEGEAVIPAELRNVRVPGEPVTLVVQ